MGGISAFFSRDLYLLNGFQNLLQSCRLIRAELKEAPEQHKATDLRLDLMFEYFKTDSNPSKTRVWPTWTRYSGPLNNVKELHIDVRISKPELIRGDQGFSKAYDIVYDPLIRLLNRFFHFRPLFVHKGPISPKFQFGLSKITLARMDQQPQTRTSRRPGLVGTIAESLFRNIRAGKLRDIVGASPEHFDLLRTPCNGSQARNTPCEATFTRVGRILPGKRHQVGF